jgi:hypothetical protein
VTASVVALCISCLVEIGSGIIASSLATLRPLIVSSFGSLNTKFSGTLPSFGFSPKRSTQPTLVGNSLSASSALRSGNSNVSFSQSDNRHDKKYPQLEEKSCQDEYVREEVVFSPEPIHGSFFADESDHEETSHYGHSCSREGPIQEVEVAHIKGADIYHTWESY